MTLEGNGSATRGVIANLSWNTAKAERWGAGSYSGQGQVVSYEATGKTLLSDLFGDFANSDGTPKDFKEAIVTAVPLNGIGYNKVTVSHDDLAKLPDVTTTSVTKEVLDGEVVLNSLLGKKVNVFFGKDNKIVSIKVVTDNEMVGVLDYINTTSSKVKVNSKEYSFASGYKVFMNGVELTGGSRLTDLKTAIVKAGVTADSDNYFEVSYGAKATIRTEATGQVESIDVFVADEHVTSSMPAGYTVEQVIVKEVDSDNVVKNVSGTTSKEFDLDDLTDVNTYFVTKNGEKATKGDITAGDVVTAIYNGSTTHYIVTDNKVMGTVSGMTEDTFDGVVARKKITIDSKVYQMVTDGTVKMSQTDDYDDAVVVGSSITDFNGKEATLYLNANGQIIYVTGAVKSTTGAMYGVVKTAYTSQIDTTTGTSKKYIGILGTDGVEKLYQVSDDKYKVAQTSNVFGGAASTTLGSSNPAVGTVVAYKPEADETLKAENIAAFPTSTGIKYTDSTISDTIYVEYVAAVTNQANFDYDNKTLTTSNGDVFFGDSAVYLNNDSSNTEKLAGFDVLASSDSSHLFDDNNFFIVYKGSEVSTVFMEIASDNSYLNSSDKYAVYVESGYEGTDRYLVVMEDTTETTKYTLASVKDAVYDSVYSVEYLSGAKPYIQAGDLFKYQVNSDGELTSATLTGGVTSGLVVDKSVVKDAAANSTKVDADYAGNGKVKFANGTFKNLETDVVVYDVRGDDSSMWKIGSTDDIKKGVYLSVVETDTTDDDKENIVVIVK
jgi:hypothetical protein